MTISYIAPVLVAPGFAWGRYPSGGYHPALDYPVPTGTHVRAPASGRIIEAGWDTTGYGNHIRILHANGHMSILAHLDLPYLVRVGQVVAQGDYVANSDNSGRSSGPHLHWETRTSSTGLQRYTAYDQTSYIRGWTGTPADTLPSIGVPDPSVVLPSANGRILRAVPSTVTGELVAVDARFTPAKRVA